MYSVYVLNNSYECISQTSFVRARELVGRGSAEVVKWSNRVVRTASEVIKVPLMIRIFRYVRAFGRIFRYHNRIVWERDDYCCQYCGKKITSKSDLQTDHVFPESRGGKTEYENMVTACFDCNQKKADRIPEESGMKLLRQPFRPQMSKGMIKICEEAKKILDEMEW